MHWPRRVARTLLAPVLFGGPVMTLSACGGEEALPSLGGALPAVARVVVAPDAPALVAGASMTLVATVADSQGRRISGKVVRWRSDAPAVATVDQLGVVAAVAVGSTRITANVDGVSGSANLTVNAPPATGTVIDVDPSVSYQTIIGWQGEMQSGEIECDRTAFARYAPVVFDRAIDELGLNGVIIGLRSGWENPVDEFPDIIAGRLSIDRIHEAAYYAINDNADPFVADPKGFQWSMLDYRIENVLLPLRRRMAARGERLYVRMLFEDWIRTDTPQPFRIMKDPEEFAEYVTEAFKHIRAKYGFSPDALELNNEPEHTGYTGTQMGRALVAAAKRLAAAGFHPDFVAPGTTSMANASTFYDEMIAVPEVRSYLTDLSYHRYQGVSDASLRQIAARQQRDGVRTAMLEHIGSGVDDLWDDLTIANNSSWMQYALAYCGQNDNPTGGGVYYQINQSDPANPKINFTTRARQLRQVFFYVRAGAVRIGAPSSDGAELRAMAFRNANGTYVVIAHARTRGASFTVRGLPAGRYGITYATASEYGVPLPDAVVAPDGTLTTSIPAGGLLTIFAR
jgi:hypothetical protein